MENTHYNRFFQGVTLNIAIEMSYNTKNMEMKMLTSKDGGAESDAESFNRELSGMT